MSLEYNDSQRTVFNNTNNNTTNSSDQSGMDSLDKFALSLKLNERMSMGDSKYFLNSQRLNQSHFGFRSQHQQQASRMQHHQQAYNQQQTDNRLPRLTSQPKSFQQIDLYKQNVFNENPLFAGEKVEANFKQNELIKEMIGNLLETMKKNEETMQYQFNEFKELKNEVKISQQSIQDKFSQMNQDSVVANISVKLTDLQTQLFGKLNSQSCELKEMLHDLKLNQNALLDNVSLLNQETTTKLQSFLTAQTANLRNDLNLVKEQISTKLGDSTQISSQNLSEIHKDLNALKYEISNKIEVIKNNASSTCHTIRNQMERSLAEITTEVRKNNTRGLEALQSKDKQFNLLYKDLRTDIMHMKMELGAFQTSTRNTLNDTFNSVILENTRLGSNAFESTRKPGKIRLDRTRKIIKKYKKSRSNQSMEKHFIEDALVKKEQTEIKVEKQQQGFIRFKGCVDAEKSRRPVRTLPVYSVKDNYSKDDLFSNDTISIDESSEGEEEETNKNQSSDSSIFNFLIR